MDGDKVGIIIILVGLLGALVPAFIASSKGRSFFLWYLYGICIFPVAVLHSLFVKPNENAIGMRKCPNCASVISSDAKICPACRTNLGSNHAQEIPRESPIQESQANFIGERNISSSPYQLFLIKKYGIEKNNTLEKYVFDNEVFDTLIGVLQEADRRYVAELGAIEREQTERILQAEIENRANQERLRRDSEIAAQKHHQELKRQVELEKITAIRNKRIRVLVTVLLIVGIPPFLVFAYKSSVESKRIASIIAEDEKQREIAAKKAADIELQKKEIVDKTDEDLRKMFFSHDLFGFKIGEKNLALLDNKVGIDDIKWAGQDTGYGKTKRYWLVTYRDSLEKITNNLELANRLKEISFSYCATPNSSFKINNKSTYGALILNGVYIEFASLDEARSFDTKIFVYNRGKEPSLTAIGSNKVLYRGVGYEETSPTVAIFRTGKDYFPTNLQDFPIDPCGNKLKRR